MPARSGTFTGQLGHGPLASVVIGRPYDPPGVGPVAGGSTSWLDPVEVHTAETAADIENRLRAGGLGYGDLKKALFEHYWEHFAAARAKRAELAANLEYINQMLRTGATKARSLAQTVLKRAKAASGLD